MAHLNQFVEPIVYLSLCVNQNSRLHRIYLGSPPSVVDMGYPLLGFGDQIQVLGSCNGRLCIANSVDIDVWDPSTKRNEFLRPLSAEEGRASEVSICVYGFGCDVRNGTFKLLRLFQRFPGQGYCEVSIYNMTDHTWRRLPDIAYNLVYQDKMGVFACGRLHFVVTQGDAPAKFLLAFDCHAEVFEEVGLPVGIDDRLHMVAAVLDGHLCLSIQRNHVDADVYIQEVYGSQQPWDRLFSISRPDDVRHPGFVYPLVYSENRRHVLVRRDRRNLVWYDLDGRPVIMVHIGGMPNSFGHDVCVM